MSKITRREMLGGGAVAAIFGGQYLLEDDFPGILRLDPVFGIMTGRCGATHVTTREDGIGEGLCVTAGHCIQDSEQITDLRFKGRPVQRVGGEVRAFLPESYEREGLASDYGYIYDPYLAGKPAVRVATPEMFTDLRTRVRGGERVMAKAVGYGTTTLDSNGRPTEVSDRLKGIHVEIVSINSEKIVVRDPKGGGGVCVGDSGSALLIDGVIYAVVSSVQLNFETGAYCDTDKWPATYRSLEARHAQLVTMIAAARQGLLSAT